MGDWEEFCDANGWDVGSEDDYNSFINSLDEEPRSSRRGPTAPTTEIEPTASRDDLIGALLQGVCQRGVEVEIKDRIQSKCRGQIFLDAFDDWPDAPWPRIYLCIEHDLNVPVSFLIEVMRESGLPLLTDNNEWLAWDTREQRLKCGPVSREGCWYSARAKKPEASLEEHEMDLVRFLHRAALSMDHGKKPLLLHSEHLYDAMNRREFEYEDPRRIPNKDVGNYILAYYNSTGKTTSIPLERAAKLEHPVFTRTSAYMWCDGDLVPLLNNASLLVGAFLMAVSHNPNEFQWFVARERGTIFHSAVERIEAPRAPTARDPHPAVTISRDAQRQTYVTRESYDALQIATDLTDYACAPGTVYLTLGGHPVDSKVVTTPEMYLHAVTTLYRLGYSIDYNLGNGARLTKRTNTVEKPIPFKTAASNRT